MRSLFHSFRQQRQQDRRAHEYRELIRKEAAIGGTLFGPIPTGGRREFFCLDEHTWVWHEEWVDGKGVHHTVTTRFDVRPHGIFKAQDGQAYKPLSAQEAKYFHQAVKLYHKKVGNEIYQAFQ